MQHQQVVVVHSHWWHWHEWGSSGGHRHWWAIVISSKRCGMWQCLSRTNAPCSLTSTFCRCTIFWMQHSSAKNWAKPHFALNLACLFLAYTTCNCHKMEQQHQKKKWVRQLLRLTLRPLNCDRWCNLCTSFEFERSDIYKISMRCTLWQVWELHLIDFTLCFCPWQVCAFVKLIRGDWGLSHRIGTILYSK